MPTRSEIVYDPTLPHHCSECWDEVATAQQFDGIGFDTVEIECPYCPRCRHCEQRLADSSGLVLSVCEPGMVGEDAGWCSDKCLQAEIEDNGNGPAEHLKFIETQLLYGWDADPIMHEGFYLQTFAALALLRSVYALQISRAILNRMAI